jgi:hypothetical protein
LTELEKDENFMKEFRECVKWEDLIRSFAFELHIRQQQNARVEIRSLATPILHEGKQEPTCFLFLDTVEFDVGIFWPLPS